ncbi:TPA: hypothetical protein JBH17_08410 [Legionella pneumophila]|nr:hypothetical protein [Legionella pneumophila]
MSENDLDLINHTENKTIFLPPKPNGLIVDYHKIKHENKTCMWPDCGNPPINSHVLSKASIRKYANNQIIELQTIADDPFHITKLSNQRKYFKPCDLDKISTFKGFCSEHDHSLFYDLDNYNGDITPKIVLLSHYRILCFGLDVIKLQLKRNEFLRTATLNAAFIGEPTKKTKEIERKIKSGFIQRRLKMAEEDYLYRKQACEQMIINNSPLIDYVHLKGSMNDALFFGRAGIFIHGFNKTRLPIRFMAQMPYISYFSICDGKSCDLVFTNLTLDKDEYGGDLECFINHIDLKKRLEILIYSQSDCCILRKNIPDSWDESIKKIVDYYR